MAAVIWLPHASLPNPQLPTDQCAASKCAVHCRSHSLYRVPKSSVKKLGPSLDVRMWAASSGMRCAMNFPDE